MTGNQVILMRRVGVKVNTGCFRSGSRVALDGKCGTEEVLCAVRNDGTNARILDVGKDGVFSEGNAPAENDMLFTVRRTPFSFSAQINAGPDSDGCKWMFETAGDCEILMPEVFAAKFRGAVTVDEPLFVETFKSWLGTIPATAMHDKVISEVLGLMALRDMDAEGRYIDLQYRLEESKEVGEKVVSDAINKAFSTFFTECPGIGANPVARMSVTSFRAFSADREAKLADDAKYDAEVRRQAQEIAALQHEAEIARLNNDKAKVEADTEELKAKAKTLLGSVETLDKLMNMNFAAGNAPNLAKLLAYAGKNDAVGRIMDAVDSAMRGDSRVTMDIEPRTRAIGPRLRAMRQGGLYSLSIDVPRDGYLSLFDICDDNKVIPVVPCSDSKSKSTFVKAGQTVLVGSKSSPWIDEPFEQYEDSGKDRFVAFIAAAPLLSPEESVQFGDELRPETVSLVANRLAKSNVEEICGGLLQVRIERK